MIEEMFIPYLRALGWIDSDEGNGNLKKDGEILTVSEAIIKELKWMKRLEREGYMTCPDCGYKTGYEEFISLSGLP